MNNTGESNIKVSILAAFAGFLLGIYPQVFLHLALNYISNLIALLTLVYAALFASALLLPLGAFLFVRLLRGRADRGEHKKISSKPKQAGHPAFSGATGAAKISQIQAFTHFRGLRLLMFLEATLLLFLWYKYLNPFPATALLHTGQYWLMVLTFLVLLVAWLLFAFIFRRLFSGGYLWR